MHSHSLARKNNSVYVGNHGGRQKLNNRRRQTNVVDLQAVDGACEVVDARLVAGNAQRGAVHEAGEDVDQTGVKCVRSELQTPRVWCQS